MREVLSKYLLSAAGVSETISDKLMAIAEVDNRSDLEDYIYDNVLTQYSYAEDMAVWGAQGAWGVHVVAHQCRARRFYNSGDASAETTTAPFGTAHVINANDHFRILYEQEVLYLCIYTCGYTCV